MKPTSRILCATATVLPLLAGNTPGLLAEAPHIENRSPLHPPRTVQLEEMWRVGGDDEDLLLGAVINAETDAGGNVYLLDNQLCQVEVFSPEGEHLRTISRRGEGPGEVLRPVDIALLPDQTMGLVELFPGKIVKLSPAGEPRGTIRIGGEGGPETGFTVSVSCQHEGGTTLLVGQHSVTSELGQDRVQYICRLTETGEEAVRFREAKTVLNFRKMHFVERDLVPSFYLANAVGPKGRVYVPESRELYAIEVYRPDGTLEKVIERAFEQRKRDAREMRRWEALFDAWGRGVPGTVTREIESYKPVISSLHVTSDGTLWVEHARSDRDQPEGIFLSYDTFDSQGHYLREVHIACDGDPAFDGLVFLRDDRVLLVRGLVVARLTSLDASGAALGDEEETGPMEVICCRMAS